MTATRVGFGSTLSPTIFNGAVRGNQQAQRVLFETFKPAVLRTLMGLCHDRELARDLAQDVFIQAFRKLHQVRDSNALGGWLKQMTIRTALAEFRTQKQTISLADNDAPDPTWQSMADWLTQLDDVEHLISQLEPQERAIVWLFIGEGYTHDEIAELVQQSSSAVRQRYRRALLKLYRYLNEGQHD